MTAPTITEELESRPRPHRLRPADGERRGLREDDPFEARLAQIERSVAAYARSARRRARAAKKFITKHRHEYHRKKVRVASGLVLRTTGVVVAGAYLAARGAVVHGRRAYKRTSPHVRRVAGGAARAGYAYTTVYGRHMATTVRRKALRAAARQRAAMRRRRTLRANPDLHASLVASGAMSTRSIRVARRAAQLFADTSAPWKTPAEPRPKKPALAVVSRVHTTRTAPKPSGGSMSKPSVPAMASTNPAYHLSHGFRLLAEVDPDRWLEWLYFLQETATAFRIGSESYTQLAIHMDLRRRMDPRALAPLYLISGGMSQLADLSLASANKFWQLYSDRLDKKNNRGRAMNNEEQFFSE